jgi:M6 family metalloprotease-like protein
MFLKFTSRSTLVALTLAALALNAQLIGYTVMASSNPILPAGYPSKQLIRSFPTDNDSLQATTSLGVVRVLIIAVAFSDIKPTMSISELRQEWFGTVVNYYNEVSYGRLKIQGDMYGWYTLPNTLAHYGRDCKGINDADCSGTNQSWKIANDAVPLAQKDVNFANYDYYVFIHSGTGQETSDVKNDIWSVTYFNASVGTTSKTLTSFSIVPETEEPPSVANGDWCVEFAHLLGVPDLYDTSNGPNQGKSILGQWDLMDKGSWNGDPPGSLPAHMTAWPKIQLGFIDGSLLETAPDGVSTFTIDPTEIASNNVHAVKVPIADSSSSSQYYLVEVRQQIGFDAALPASGVLITYVDEAKTIGKVRLINADPGVADLSNAAWQIGQTFSDSSHALSIAVTAASGRSYEVTVTRPAASPPFEETSFTNSTTRITIAGTVVVVELATTPQAQQNGLSGRPSLPEDHGMLFVFDHEDYWSFWMPNMKFPLDIIWFDSAHKVVWTELDVQPCSSLSNCPVMTPESQAMYVLEVNAGFVTTHHIQLGITFSFLAD